LKDGTKNHCVSKNYVV